MNRDALQEALDELELVSGRFDLTDTIRAAIAKQEAQLAAWHEMVTMTHINRDGLWPNNWPQDVAWIAHCLHNNSIPPKMIDEAIAATGKDAE